ncbi:hypothetical protein WICPIJ_002693 [Wickerhamomyces pijperi]|uniref:Uncharacterized protein n=1 Tax=Wickerhamomyces pijperi TaxID=599730 RepID=A0A9P8TPX8_WICPI|nr:hypothetical protein WICPIJ_002693 [Wickerhamomyces pijperi]
MTTLDSNDPTMVSDQEQTERLTTLLEIQHSIKSTLIALPTDRTNTDEVLKARMRFQKVVNAQLFTYIQSFGFHAHSETRLPDYPSILTPELLTEGKDVIPMVYQQVIDSLGFQKATAVNHVNILIDWLETSETRSEYHVLIFLLRYVLRKHTVNFHAIWLDLWISQKDEIHILVRLEGIRDAAKSVRIPSSYEPFNTKYKDMNMFGFGEECYQHTLKIANERISSPHRWFGTMIDDFIIKGVLKPEISKGWSVQDQETLQSKKRANRLSLMMSLAMLGYIYSFNPLLTYLKSPELGVWGNPVVLIGVMILSGFYFVTARRIKLLVADSMMKRKHLSWWIRVGYSISSFISYIVKATVIFYLCSCYAT